MATDYTYLYEEYPEVISADQLYRICHISKRKAKWLLEHGYIPCEDSGKKTRRYKIRLNDVIDYLRTLEAAPDLVATPVGAFNVKRKQLNPVAQICQKEFQRFLYNIWRDEADILRISDVQVLLGYSAGTIRQWILRKELRSTRIPCGIQVTAKEWLIDFTVRYKLFCLKMSDFTSSWQGYDFSGLGALLSQMQEFTRPVMEAVHSIQSALKPIVEAIEQYRPKVAEIGQALLQATRPLSAIRKMGEAQFVFWDHMTDEFVDAIVGAENINKTLREQLIRDRFSAVNKTIDKTLSSAVMQKHKRLYSQSVNAFRSGDSDLAVTGFTSVFDGLLADTSGNPTSRLGPRINAIKQKLDNDELLNHDEYATITLAMTLEKPLRFNDICASSFFASSFKASNSAFKPSIVSLKSASVMPSSSMTTPT